jgi:MFS family permease
MDRSVTATLLAAPGFTELWIAGGVANAMLWLEVLAAGLFTFQATGSGLAVAIVSAARSFPLLLTGAFIGVLSETVNRKRIVVGGLVLTGITSVSVGALGLCGVLRPWHVGVAALISGVVYATEMPARRRMISECAGEEARPGAVAVDSITNYATRCAGPILGGVAYQSLGLPGAFLISAVCSLGASAVVSRIPHFQPKIRRFPIRRALTDLRDAVAFARASKTLAALLGITIITNLFGYSYSALVTPLGLQVFKGSSTMVGVLASAEPAGSLVAGWVIAVRTPRGRPIFWLAAGAAGLFLALGLASLVGRSEHPFVPVLSVLFVGGFASALYNIFQTTIVIDATPELLRSRMMGLVTVCIGTWPLGTVIAGALSRPLGSLGALGALGGCGLVCLGLIAATVFRR